MKQTVNLPVFRYMDTNGNPTCKTDEGMPQQKHCDTEATRLPNRYSNQE